MDHFMEEVVVKKRRGMNEVLYVLALVLMVVSAILAVWEITACINVITAGGGFGSIVIDLIFGVANGAIAVLLYLFRDRLRTEYEYTFTNGDLDFAQVFNNNKRKTLGTLKVRTVDAFGPVSGQAFQRYISMPGVQQSRWFLNRESELYFFYFQKESNKRVIVCEPSKELVDMIRQYLPRGAWQE